MMAFAFIAFFLGNNLNIYIWCFLFTSFYLLINRIIRFYIKRYLLYFFEFCYFGISTLLIYIIYCPENKKFWYATYICNTGMMALSVLILNNQALFNSTDHITSAWIHTVPMITCWVIRWRHVLFDPTILSQVYFKFNDVSSTEFNYNDELVDLGLYAFCLWLIWMSCFIVFVGFVFRNYVDNPKYCSSISDFRRIVKNLPFINHRFVYKDLKVKYCLQHLIGFIFCLPLAILCYYNIIFNTLYGGLICCYLYWNQCVKSDESINKKVYEKSGILVQN